MHRDRAACAGLVFDDYRLFDVLAQLGGQQAGHHIHGASGRRWHQNLDRFVGPGQRRLARQTDEPRQH
ncbi:hypothetical protein D3C85_1870520 [compost metagenome]